MTPVEFRLLAALEMSDIAPHGQSELQSLEALVQDGLAAWIEGPRPPGGGGPPIRLCRITLKDKLLVEESKHPKPE